MSIVLFFAASSAFAVRGLSEFDGETLPSGSEILRRNLDANGGRTNLENFHSFLAKGVITDSGGQEREFRTYRKRPQQMKTIIDDGQIQTVLSFDGERGWRQVVRNGVELDVRELEGENLNSIKSGSKFDGPVLQYEDRPENIRPVSLEEIDGEQVVRVEFQDVPPDGFDTGWISTKHFQTIRLARTSVDESGEEVIEREMSFFDFEKVNGVYVAMRSETRQDGELVQSLRIDELRANVGIFDSFFERP